MSHFFKTTLLLLSMLWPFSAYSGEDWTLSRDEDGIQVFTRAIDNDPNLMFRATGMVNQRVAEIVAIMRDITIMDQWLDTTYDHVILNEPAPECRLIDMKVRTPFIVKDRELILTQCFRRIDASTVRVDLNGQPDARPITDDGLVRIPYFKGFWLLEQVDGHRTRVTYQGHLDSGGLIPAFVTNALLTKAPYESILKLGKVAVPAQRADLAFLK